MTTAFSVAARPRLDALLSLSWAILREHPVVSSALGAAVLLSMASSLFAVGVFATPWFVCEIFALQLAVLTERASPRRSGWVRAAALVLALVGLVVAATWIAAMAIGPDVSTADSARSPLPWPDALERVATIAGIAALTVGFIAPFVYAPLILIERGGTIGNAALESAWLVRRGGLARHWTLTFLAQLLPLAPALVAAVVVGRTFERAATPVGVLLGLPLLPITIPLGLGLVTAAYVERRRELAEPRWTRSEARAPRSLIVLLIAVVLAPMASVALLAIGAARPSAPARGAATGELVIAREIDGPSVLYVPDTTLAIEVDGREVRVRSGDGGGAGRLAEPWDRPIERVRVRRRGDVYAIELHAGRRRWHASVDRAAMRVDDSIGSRLERRLPWWALPVIALAFGASAILLVRALAALGAVRRAYGVPARPARAALRTERRRALETAWLVGLVLAPIGACAVYAGLLAWIG